MENDIIKKDAIITDLRSRITGLSNYNIQQPNLEALDKRDSYYKEDSYSLRYQKDL